MTLFVSALMVQGAGALATEGDSRLDGDAGSTPRIASARVAAAGGGWSDVPGGHWARGAIDAVARERDWMRDFGDSEFRPEAIATRKHLARAVVRAFAPSEGVKKGLKFADLPVDNRFFRFANVAVKLRWMSARGGKFHPDDPVTVVMLHRALVGALDLAEEAKSAANVRTAGGELLATPTGYGSTLLGMIMGLRYNHDDESQDVGPRTPLPRSEVAWSLYRASVIDTSETWRRYDASDYAGMKIGNLSPKMKKVVEFGLRFVGYPYIYAGEWAEKTPSNYCCGDQPRGGFDCSGFMWWLVKAPDNGFDNTRIRKYQGWSLPERSSNDMAKAIPASERLTYKQARAGDLFFYDSDSDGTIDHVNLFLGFGWALDSSSGTGGVMIVRVNDGWYHDNFVWGRRITG